MAKVRNTFMTKVAALLLSLSMLLGMLPTSIVTAFALSNTDTYGTLSILSSGGTVTDANSEKAVATFDDVTLTWDPADPSIGRVADGWWVGIKMTAPATMTKEADFTNVTYQRCTSAIDDTWYTNSFWDAQDSNKNVADTERYLTMWGRINEEFLNDAIANNTTINYTWRFDWNADGVYEQTADIKIKPENIKLIKDAVQVYPSTVGNGTVTTYSEGLAVQGDANANYVKVTYTSDAVLNWVEKNTEIGRMQDGWWAGVKVTAPSTLQTETDFNDVTYQSRTSDGWSAAKNFWQYKDSANSATEHFIGLWGLLNVDYLKKATTTFSYSWRFDWNKDGVYEQIVIIEIVPSHITLKNEAGTQVYPELGDVTTITGGTVSGTKTGDVVVDASNVTLNWSPKDESIGRYTDGWWAGILITAPNNIVLTESDDVKYQSKVGTNDWSAEKSFYKNQDSAKDAASHYMQLWSVLNREKIAENEKVTTQWRFDWDKDGKYEQLVTFNVDSATVTLNRIDRTDFVFEETATDLEVWIGDGTYKNEAASILAPGKVTYAIDESSTANATVNADTGVITLGGVGTVKVNATIAETDVYNAKTISFTFKVVKTQPEGLKFAFSSPSAITYSENGTFENEANDPIATGAITYSIIKHEDLEGNALDAATDPVATIDENGKLTIKRSGKVTVMAVRAEDGKYLADEEKYTLTINKAEQTGFGFTTSSPTELTYSTTPYDTVKVEGGQVEDAKITYTITSGNDVVEIVDGNKIKTLKKGDFVLSVTKAGNDCYNPVTITREMKVTVAEQTTFAFTYPTPNSITYNENGNKYENVALGGESSGEVTYKVVVGNDVADFENAEKPAELTIKKAGTVKVEATKAADDRYAAKTISYEITIEKAEQAFTFVDGAAVIKNYGIKEYTNAVVSTVVPSKADGIGHGEGAFNYTIEENDIGASIDSTTGKITFGDSTNKIGKVKVSVTRAADEKYKSCSNEYTIEIKYPTVPATAYTIDKTVNANGWYDGDIKISAPDGYLIAYDNELSTSAWATYVMYSTEGTTCPVIYFKADNGDITDAITVTDYQMDKSAPINLTIDYNITIWETILEKVFGFAADKVTVTLKAEDIVSGIDYIWYSLDNGTTYPDSQKVELENGQYSFDIPAEFRNVIEFKAVDMAGNTTKYSDGKTVVVDSVVPNLDVEYDYFGLNRKSNNIIYTNDKVTVNFTLEATNFDLSVAPVVKVNGEEQVVVWNSNDNKHTTNITLTATDDYTVTCDFVDRLGRAQNYSQKIHVDKVAPAISDFEFTPGDVKNTVSKRNYYDADQTVKVVITEHNFDPSFVNLEVAADNVAVDVAEYLADFKKTEKWTPGANDTWTTEIPFAEDANYTVKISYTDLAGNSKTSDSYEFTVDTTAPEKPTIKLDKAFLAKVAETVTFGFYKAPVEVTVTSSDITAGIKEIKYSYVGKKGEYNEAVVNVGATIVTDNDTIKFTIPANTEFKGIISATAYDWSMNDSDEQNVSYDKNSVELGGIVVDNINPERTVLITEANRVVDASTLKDVQNYDYTKENTNSILYYNDKATLTFIIDEANFYSEDVHVYVNGVETNPTDWDIVNNKWQGTITLADEGDYIVTMEYTDKSTNVMNSYKSEKIVIDKTAPIISTEYHNKNIINTVDGREYYDSTQTATITVKEHNFRADDFKVKVYAKDINGNTVLTVDENGYVKAYAEDGAKRTEWTDYSADWRRVDDTYQLNITYSADANYTFDAEYTDLATNKDESDVEKEFTVDTTDADELNVKYSTDFIDNILSSIFFYNPKATVEISAKDDVAGIEYFSIGVKKDGLTEATNIELPEGLVVNADGTVKAGTKGFIGEITSVKEGGKVTLSFEVPAQFRGEFIIESVTDLSHNDSAEYDDNNIVVVDTISPDVKVEFTGSLKDKIDVDVAGQKPTRQTKNTTDANTRFVYDGDITATITVKEANFYDDMVITVYRDGAVVTDSVISDWTQINGTFEYVKTVKLSEDGDYQIKLDYEDKSDNKMDVDATGEYAENTADKGGTYTSNIHTIDTTIPTYSITYDNNTVIQTIGGRDYFDANRTATIKVTDRNFRPNEVDFTVVAKDIKNNDVTEFTYSKLTSLTDWTQDGITWTATVPFTTDANYTVDFTYTDIAGHKVAEDYNKRFTVDKTDADELNVKYSTNFIDNILSSIFFYNPKATVEISAKDDVAGIEYFSIGVKKDGLTEATNIELPEGLVVNADGTVKAGTKGFIGEITSVKEGGKVTLSFEVPAQFRGEFIIESVTDLSHNDSAEYDDNNIVVVDTISPDVKVEFTGSLKDKIDVDVAGQKPTRQTKNTTDANTRFVYDGDITATITVKEANFYDDMVITVYRDGAVVTDSVISDWTQINGTFEYVKTVKLSEDGDYQIKLDYEDKSDNKMDVDATGEYAENTADKVGTYTSNIHTIDTTIPTYSITYDNNTVIHNIDGRDYFDANRTATIKVTDRNFRPNEVKFTVVAKDVVNADVTAYTYSKLVSWDDWTQDGITWTATVPFTTDANYTVDFTYTDIAGHKVAEDYNKLFTVDKVAPSNLKIEYVEPSFVEKVIETVTFHFYKAPVKVKISATDDTAGVYHFMYSYVKSTGVSAVNAELIDEAITNADITYDGNKATATFTIPKEALAANNQFRGNVEFTAYDRSENDDDTKDPTVVVVDDIAPQIDVTYTANDVETEIRYVDSNVKDVEDFKSATQAFYNGNVTAKITIDEANFFEGKNYTDENGNPVGIVHEVGILLTKTDNNGVVTKTEYMPAGSAQMFASETSNRKNIEWTHDGDIHTFEIDYDENADYVLTVKYVDFSTNESDIDANDGKAVVKLYESKIVTVDKIDPVIKVEYNNADVKNTIDGRKYFDKQQVATITVTEHNFRADDVDVDVIAKNVIDEDVSVADFDAQLRNRDNWKHYDEEGNEVEKAVDGNVHVATITYSVDANYTFDIAYTDLAKHAAKDYTEDLFTVDKTAPTNLTVTYSEPKLWDKILESITFGFYNAQMEVTITADDITTGIYHFKYSYIKSEGVSDVNAELIDEAIAAAEITYSGATATAKFSIPKLVLKNDNQFNGTVKFTAYDRSENNTDMADEERIVVDNIKPTSKITFNEPVQNVNNISYYAGDINATIVITEANFYSEDVNVTVTKDGANYPVTVQWKDDSVDVHTGTFTLTEDGDYIVTIKYADRSTNEMETYESNRLTIDTKAPSVSVSNIKNNSANKDEKYGFTITANDINIDMNSIKPVLTAVVREEDGSYATKTISLGDIKTVEAGKTYSFTVDNLEADAVYTLVCALKDMSGNEYSKISLSDGKEYETVKFSINRDGSTFTVNEATFKLLTQYYVYSVDSDVVIEEINVDPIENYVVKLNGEPLTEGKDYTTTITEKDGEWSKRTYVVKKSLFENEGEYNVIVESIDKAETTAFSDVKNLKVAFVVDQTAPVLTISGLEEGGRYQIDEQTVTVIPTDDGGKLNSFKAILLDSDGKELEVRFEKSGNDLIKYLEENDGKITFTVPEGLENQVRIICDDCAVNADGKTNAYDQTFTKVTVSQSGWVIYYANKPLFYGSIAGVILLAGGIIFLIVYKKRKKNEASK